MMKKAFVLALALGLATLCASAQAQAPKYANGSYVLDYQDDELGSVSISVTVKDNRIVEVSLPKGKGDIAMDDKVLGEWLKAFVAAPDFMKVDVVSGATQSCDLIRYAVQNVLKKAILAN